MGNIRQMEGILLMPNNASSNVITCCSQDPVTNALQGTKVYAINYFYSCHKTPFLLIFLYLSYVYCHKQKVWMLAEKKQELQQDKVCFKPTAEQIALCQHGMVFTEIP